MEGKRFQIAVLPIAGNKIFGREAMFLCEVEVDTLAEALEAAIATAKSVGGIEENNIRGLSIVLVKSAAPEGMKSIIVAVNEFKRATYEKALHEAGFTFEVENLGGDFRQITVHVLLEEYEAKLKIIDQICRLQEININRSN